MIFTTRCRGAAVRCGARIVGMGSWACIQPVVLGVRKGSAQMLEEFKKFALRGNVVDLAVGVIIGVAFGSIVTSLVSDIIMPIIGAITGGLDF